MSYVPPLPISSQDTKSWLVPIQREVGAASQPDHWGPIFFSFFLLIFFLHQINLFIIVQENRMIYEIMMNGTHAFSFWLCHNAQDISPIAKALFDDGWIRSTNAS